MDEGSKDAHGDRVTAGSLLAAFRAMAESVDDNGMPLRCGHVLVMGAGACGSGCDLVPPIGCGGVLGLDIEPRFRGREPFLQFHQGELLNRPMANFSAIASSGWRYQRPHLVGIVQGCRHHAVVSGLHDCSQSPLGDGELLRGEGSAPVVVNRLVPTEDGQAGLGHDTTPGNR